MVVMYVDDDKDDVTLFSEAVDGIDNKTEIILAGNGEEALRVLETQPANVPTLIFLDINMPIMNGIECLKAIRTNPKFEHVAVYICSTYIAKNEHALINRLNANGFVKPDTYRELETGLRKIFKSVTVINNNGSHMQLPSIVVQPALRQPVC